MIATLRRNGTIILILRDISRVEIGGYIVPHVAFYNEYSYVGNIFFDEDMNCTLEKEKS